MGDAAHSALPATDRVLRAPAIRDLTFVYSRDVVVALVRQVVQDFRTQISEGAQPPEFDSVVRETMERAGRWQPSPLPVINATGVILHTNLGRAPLGEAAMAAVAAASGY